MTLTPLGAQLAAFDPPPPPSELDPREPSPSLTTRRGQRSPVKARSPAGSRAASPSRPANHRDTSSDGVPLHQPTPKPLSPPSPSPSGVPIQSLGAYSHAPHGHHLSRPSSPSSIHSSTSAIFERDIELPPVASLSLNPNPPLPHTLSHKSSRLSHLSHGSALDHTVPAVLDDAVEALAGTGAYSRGIEGLEIEGPAPAGISMARQNSANVFGIPGRKVSTGPVGLSTSRSPSPISVASRGSSVASPAQSPPILGQLQTQQSFSSSASPSTSPTATTGSVPRPAIPNRMSTGQQVPGAWSSAWRKEEAPVEEGAAPPAPTPPAAIPPHLTPTKDKRRISFISYNDLLLSVPTTVTPLGEITSGNLSPDHLPGTVSPSISSRSPIVPPQSTQVAGFGGGAGAGSGQVTGATGGVEHKSSWDATMGGGFRGRGLGLGEGEWEREGLGKGLEQRLEDLVQSERP